MGNKKLLLLSLLAFIHVMIFAQTDTDFFRDDEIASELDGNSSDNPYAELPENNDLVDDSSIESPAIQSPTIVSPAVEGPAIESPTIVSPAIVSPAVEGEPSFRLSETDTCLLFLQRLTWEEALYAVRYTVILERKTEHLDMYAEVLRRNVEITYIDISVPPGEYRYRVLSYNILGMLDSQSDWEYFDVIQALYPTILTFTPNAFYFDRLTPRIILLTGENLLPEAEIYLESKTLADENGDPLILKPSEIFRNELGENMRLVFNEEDLLAGVYEIVIVNPGGLEFRAGDFSIAMAKPYDINVSGGYTPMFTLFGQKDYFLSRFFIPAGLSIRASFVPFKWNFGFLGAEISPNWAFLSSAQNDFKTSAHLVLVNVDVLFQYWIIQRELSLNARAGLGFAGIFNYLFEYNTGKTGDPISTSAFSFNLGASVQWLFYKQFFVEGGLDYIHIVHSEIPMGFVRIGIFGGYQF